MSGIFQRDKMNIPGERSTTLGLAKTRLVLVASVFVLGYLAISLRLTDLTLLRDRPAQESASMGGEGVKPLTKPLRGTIVDRNGELMATSLAMPSVFANNALIDDPKQVASELAKILTEQKESDLLKKLSSGRKFVWIQRNITPRQQYAINALGHPGLGFQDEDRRIYPAGDLAAHITGYTDVDGRGIAGIEKLGNAQLEKGDKPVALTIDLRVQHILHRELTASMEKFRAKAAVGVVMDVNTGEIIAMVSLPDFDPHHPSAASDDGKFNRASLGVFEMGSTFKLFSTAAALDSGQVSFGTTFDTTQPIKVGRFTISDYHALHRIQTVPEIFIHSSNIGTARMAQTMGPDGLKNFYKRMGFFAQVPVDIPERGFPLYPNPWREISTLTASFGHGIAVSPLHLVRATAALVNGGVMVTPQLLKKENKSLLPQSPVGDRVVSPQTSLKIRQLLELTVAEGTGSKAAVEGYNVGGKTGTAEKNKNGRYDSKSLMSSFIGVFPMGEPRYAVLAILDEPKPAPDTFGYATGGWTGAPVVGRVVEQMAPLYQIPPSLDTSAEIMNEMSPYIKGAKSASAGTDR
ncbi:MAG: Cell division protein FtsI [Alphaproteobacteria bacterium]|jgi:cell division protein FtsI (penicillin-binding protein 3)|nr:Cell division protein FtsI [Alphaproteobacteria bacterium]